MCLLNARTRADGYGCDQKYPGTSLERAKGLGYYQQVGVGSGNGLRLKRAIDQAFFDPFGQNTLMEQVICTVKY
jgi:hypothetical protein